MRAELANLKGAEYFAAWEKLMANIGADVLAFYKDLRAWADDDQLEIGLYGAICTQYDLPIKTLVNWLGRQGVVNRDLYDLQVSGYTADQILKRGKLLDEVRTQGQTYAGLLEAERAERQRKNEDREREWRDKNFPVIDSAFDKNGALVRVGDKVQIAWRTGEHAIVTVKELRTRAGKVVLKNDARIFFEIDGRLQNYPAILSVLQDVFYGE